MSGAIRQGVHCLYRGIHCDKTVEGWRVFQTIRGIWLPGAFPTVASMAAAIDKAISTASR
jgi:hypothetical protein